MKPTNQLTSLLGLSLIVFLGLYLLLGASPARAAGPMENIKSLIEQIQTILQTNKDKNQRLDLIEKATAQYLDFQEMAQRCLGTNWKTLSRAQQDEFVRIFSQLLKTSYADHLDEFVKAKVNYLGENLDGNHGEVRIVVIRPNDRIPVNFHVLQKSEGWKIYDLNIEGVSMVSNYRCQFDRAISAISYQGLLGRLKSRLKECHG